MKHAEATFSPTSIDSSWSRSGAYGGGADGGAGGASHCMIAPLFGHTLLLLNSLPHVVTKIFQQQIFPVASPPLNVVNDRQRVIGFQPPQVGAAYPKWIPFNMYRHPTRT
jgi:hypothetical protein